ncbi:hypothetical protein M441DRAFT_277695 [Trichoderma asperellum CBS 433.97]|uniref:Uncharacterized protein n=1 Tax=Trichoderma asperellum (strain ATCC 204424 / CBS 433.97 / NBRC 101777) TaxID=1042311 RepID=A0A2T3YV00_TRIA4|nr:hypothetical protein M441DRAFT_277695 [Trichoderma asperellum CBS 433.97]PTB36388.1 hypothetical protein M441DRAFT_277695 [Trichoderma asperellum CBS 433.97]
MGSSTARLLAVEGLAPVFAWPTKIPSVVPERLTGQLHGGVCLEAKTSAGRVGSCRCTKPRAVNAQARRRRGLGIRTTAHVRKEEELKIGLRQTQHKRGTRSTPVSRCAGDGASIKPQKRGGLRPCVR